MMKNPEDETKLDTLQRQLTSANRAWFSRLRLFMWLEGWARDRSAVASQLLAMMQDLLDAQRGHFARTTTITGADLAPHRR